jgi:hypothetical protein
LIAVSRTFRATADGELDADDERSACERDLAIHLTAIGATERIETRQSGESSPRSRDVSIQ